MQAKIIGYITSETKKKTKGTTLYVEVEHDDYRSQNALTVAGHACEVEYIHGDYSDVLNVGEVVDLVYGKGYEGKAVLREIVPLIEK